MGRIKDSPDVEDAIKGWRELLEERLEEGARHRDDNLQQHAQSSEADGREERFTEIIQFCDKIVSTRNPSLDEDGTGNNPHAQVNPASYRYSDKVGHEASDYAELIVTVQRHAHCSPFYCLSKTQKGEWQCRFGFPKQLQDQTTIVFDEYGEPELLTKRNDPYVNSHNPMQLQGWRANVDMQVCLNARRVAEYCAKYASKPESRSVPMREAFNELPIVCNKSLNLIY